MANNVFLVCKPAASVCLSYRMNNWKLFECHFFLKIFVCHIRLKFGDTIKVHIYIRFYLFIFREMGREGEREEEKHRCVVASHPTGDLALIPGMCPDWESNQ